MKRRRRSSTCSDLPFLTNQPSTYTVSFSEIGSGSFFPLLAIFLAFSLRRAAALPKIDPRLVTLFEEWSCSARSVFAATSSALSPPAKPSPGASSSSAASPPSPSTGDAAAGLASASTDGVGDAAPSGRNSSTVTGRTLRSVSTMLWDESRQSTPEMFKICIPTSRPSLSATEPLRTLVMNEGPSSSVTLIPIFFFPSGISTITLRDSGSPASVAVTFCFCSSLRSR
mmetsp:Transcript_10705/g.27540  ORF Transcript_10705/g.27540 Transcript_10705/m.27540 type:complete len:227 (+) Transcript_10705:1282-1962(+)